MATDAATFTLPSQPGTQGTASRPADIAMAPATQAASAGTTTAIAYLNTRYPAMSHTFIEREIRALRKAGVRVRTFSIRPSTARDRLGNAHATAAAETTVLFPGVRRLLTAQLGQLLRRPIAYLRTMVAAQNIAPPGLRSRVAHVAYVFEAARLVEEMNRSGLSHVHVHMANNGAAVAQLACRMDPTLSYSLSIHGSAEFFAVKSVNLKSKSEGAAFVRCISDFCRGQVMAWTAPEHWKHFHIVHCGVDPFAFAPRPSTSHAGGPLRLVTVGRFEAIKGYPVLLEACAELSARGVDWQLTMVGDGPLRPEIERRVAELGLTGRVVLTGALGPESLPAVLDQADVMIISSFMEGVPVVLMEAMAKEMAVVATHVGGIPELIEDGRNGMLVRPASPSALAAALARLAQDPSLVRRLGTAARQRIRDDFSTEHVGVQMRDLFERYGLVPIARDRAMAAKLADKVGPLGIDNRILTATGVMGPNDSAAQSTPSVPQGAASPTGVLTDGPAPSRRYVLITPCRDEAEFARRTLESVVRQTIQPALWLIVDDGSTDETPAILAEYAARYPFIKVMRRQNRGHRSVGPGVVDAFYAGYEQIIPDDFDYVCKFDLDLDLPPTYFEAMVRQMEANPRIGTCSGKPYYPGPSNTAKSFDGELISEACGDEMSVGMIKFYRTECFRQIGGFVRQVMWDGIDCHRCRMLGWIAFSWDDAETRFLHLRPMGSSQVGIWTGRMRHGFGQHFMGTGLAYMTASAIFRMARPPVILGGAAMWWGYAKAMFGRKARYDDLTFRRFLRTYQRDCLLYGKAAATMRINERQAVAWQKNAAARLLDHANIGLAPAADAPRPDAYRPAPAARLQPPAASAAAGPVAQPQQGAVK